MKRWSCVALSMMFFLAGCGVAVVPSPQADGTVNAEERSITQNRANLEVTVRVQDLEYRPYQMVENITAFFVAVENGKPREISLPLSAFVLMDGQGNQYRPVSAEKVHEIIARDSFYLMPYPFVGYYYLEDAARAHYDTQFESALPYFPQRYPQDIYTEALPDGEVLPGARVSGLVYFIVDLTRKESFELRLYLPGTPPSAPADFNFPFFVEKN